MQPAAFPPLAGGTANQSSRVLRALPGGVDYVVVNTGAVAGWLLLYDLAAAPVDGAVTPFHAAQVPANSTYSVGFNPPALMATGCVAAFSTTGPTTQTLSATAWFGGRIV